MNNENPGTDRKLTVRKALLKKLTLLTVRTNLKAGVPPSTSNSNGKSLCPFSSVGEHRVRG